MPSKPLLALSLAVVLVAAACGGGGDGRGGAAKRVGKDSPLPQPPAVCPIGALANAAKPVRIVVWDSTAHGDEEELRQLTDRFNAQQSDVVVTLVNQVSYQETLQRYRAGLSNGVLPDLVQLDDTTVQEMADTRAVLPVQACIDAEHLTLSDYTQQALDRWVVNGVHWAMPFNVWNPVLYYNKAAFRKAGLDPNTGPATLDDVRTMAEKLKAAGVASPYGLKVEAWNLEQWLAKANETYVNNGNGRTARATQALFDNAQGRAIFQWMAQMVRDGLAATNPDQGPGELDNLMGLGTGRLAMAVDSSSALGTIQQMLATAPNPNFELGVAPMPGPVDGAGGVAVSGGALYISNRSAPEKQEAAWRFVKFLTQPDVQAEWAAATGDLPVRTSATTLPPITQQWAEHPGYKVAYDELTSAPNTVVTQGPAIGDYQAVRDAVLNAENSMFSQGRPPDQALANAARSATGAIAAYDAHTP
ncbi:MAG: ABC transporter substrate-binding protein [Actinobacteria bacterium]|nr:ABC transporter substrate-binding protein [Actinomycetota bacterium]